MFRNVRKGVTTRRTPVEHIESASAPNSGHGADMPDRPLCQNRTHAANLRSANQLQGYSMEELVFERQAAAVAETKAFLKQRPQADLATQSGPMLVINGRLHPRFDRGSTSLKARNGVG